jgi:hypothetical protein
MMLKSLLCVIVLVLLGGCSVKPQSLNTGHDKVYDLSQALLNLGKGVSKKEAEHFAKEALSYPRVLAKEYNLAAPASYHNMLINAGYRTRGLCFEWSEDMMAHLKKQHYKTIDLRWGVSDKGGPEEHNSVIAVAKGGVFESGLIVDPWRNSGDLYWSLLHEDEKYKWVEDKKRTTVLGTVKALK